MTRVRSIALLLCALAFATAGAQDAPPSSAPPEGQEPITTLKLQTKIVSVAAVVRDKKGQPVRDLTRDDFLLKEDAKDQPIRYFSAGSDLPLTLALLVDTSGSQRNYIANETAASKVFFTTMLTRPEDRAVLMQFDTDVLQLQRMTASAADLTAGLAHLSEPHNPAIGHNFGGTLLYDAIYLAARNVLAKQEGRRAMVLLTDGGDNGSRMTGDQAIAAAQRADVVVYSIFYSDEGKSSYGKRVLDAISDQTGGRVFVVGKKLPLETIYAQIADDMRFTYQIGYTPPESRPGTYHLIDLKAKDPKLTISARRGYFTKP